MTGHYCTEPLWDMDVGSVCACGHHSLQHRMNGGPCYACEMEDLLAQLRAKSMRAEQ